MIMDLDLVRNLIVVVIPVLTPVLIALLKKGVSSIPSNVLPILAPIIGALLSIVGSAFDMPVSLSSGALLGAAGVGVREIVNQNFTKK
jgi:hypothetical protein